MGETDYSGYLRIDSLLELQEPLTEGAADELLFIVVHQVYELWFKLLLHELTLGRDALLAQRTGEALAKFLRATVIVRLMREQLDLLETMSPEGFLDFRDPLAPASGFQSTQFRELEALLGMRDRSHLEAPHLTPAQAQGLRRRHEEPDIWSAFVEALGVTTAAAPAALAALYREHTGAESALLHRVAETRLDLDEGFTLWRQHHALMAAREIGNRTGTGGSAGVEYLERTTTRRFFPELWAVRSAL